MQLREAIKIAGEIATRAPMERRLALTAIEDWLAEQGVTWDEESEDAGILYFTRHYRLEPGAEEPVRGANAATGDLGYLKFGVFPGDNGCFSITICVPEIEMEMRKAIVNPDTFDAIWRGKVPGDDLKLGIVVRNAALFLERLDLRKQDARVPNFPGHGPKE